MDQVELLDCDRCGYVGPAGSVEPRPAPQSPRKRLFGWGSVGFIGACLIVGGSIFGFLMMTGQGWTHARVATLQQPLCEFMSCNLYEVKPAPPVWHISPARLDPIEQGVQIKARLESLKSGNNPLPNLQLVVLDSSGDRQSRIFTPDQYLQQDEIYLETALAIADVASVEFKLAEPTQKTLAIRR